MSVVPIDDVVYFTFTTRDITGTTPVMSDADSTPTFDVFEEATDTPILAAQSCTKRTGLTGRYRGSFTASAANGFEAGKWYNVDASATVVSVADVGTVMRFRCAPAESVAGVPKVDVEDWKGSTAPAMTGDAFARLGAPIGASTSADIAAVKSDTASTLSAVDTEVAAILAAVDTEVAAILALLNDARSEPGQGNPAVNANAVTKIDYLYKAFRNKIEQTATTLKLYDDAGTTVDQKATTSDDGTTYTRSEIVSGP